MSKSVIVVGPGNAALCAGIAALEAGAQVLMLEKGDESLAGGNTKYTAGAMRFVYDGGADLMPLLRDPMGARLPVADFGSYTTQKFSDDLLGFNDGRLMSSEQVKLVTRSGETMRWLASHDVKFEPISQPSEFQKGWATCVLGRVDTGGRKRGRWPVRHGTGRLPAVGRDDPAQ